MKLNGSSLFSAVGAGALLIATLTGCSSTSEANGASHDPDLLFETIQLTRSTLDVDAPAILADALPNRQYLTAGIGGTDRVTYSDTVVRGAVTDVEPDDNYSDEDSPIRTATLTVSPTWSTDANASEVEFVVEVESDRDPEQLLGSLSSLTNHEVVVLLKQGRTANGDPAALPALDGALLGLVDESGSISFPALGGDQSLFLNGVDSVAELEAEAARRVETIMGCDGEARLNGDTC